MLHPCSCSIHPSLQFCKLSWPLAATHGPIYDGLTHVVDDFAYKTIALWRFRGFCDVVLRDDGAFLRHYHEVRGDREICITPWHAHPGIGEVRDVKFLTFTKVGASASMPSFTSCQVQLRMVAL